MKIIKYTLIGIIIIFLFLNANVIIRSIQVKYFINKMDNGELLEKEQVEFTRKYVQFVRETKLRGTAITAKILFLDCQEWYNRFILGKHYQEL